MKDTLTDILEYHRRTKHHLDRYAAGPSSLDWDDQPDPFRRFAGCETIALPSPGATPVAAFADLHCPGAVATEPVSIQSVGLLLELSFGLSAWKQYGYDRWALRCNPSSGNLHPTEAYVLAAGVEGLEDGVYHYVSHDHWLERRCRFAPPPGVSGLWVGLSSIHWREAWKYGERAFRYCQHDVGHALGALAYGAAVLGWRVSLLPECGDSDIESLLGLDRHEDFSGAEHESADVLCLVHADGDSARPDWKVVLEAAGTGRWAGRANVLSRGHRFRWPVIEEAARLSRKPRTDIAPWQPAERPFHLPAPSLAPAAQIIRGRRSAQRFDGRTPSSRDAFCRILDAVLPRTAVPFDLWPFEPRIHLALFVHRVEGLRAGLYLLPRRDGVVESLRASMRADFLWAPVEECPDAIPLYLLVNADCRRAAMTLSCHQSIASDSVFSLGMIAEFDDSLRDCAWVYRRLFWEAGLVGQVLYLEAEAAGLRGTGIGCFFDDAVHEVLGLQDTRFQSLYHFTIGAPLEDDRLQTLPPYGHLAER